MNDDPTNVDVLYGNVIVDPPKYNQSFQNVINSIVNFFASKGMFYINNLFKQLQLMVNLGLVRQQYENVKLHATLINSLFRKGDKQNKNEKDKKQSRESFDATYILNKYKNYSFGSVPLKFVHLSVRYPKANNMYYDAVSTIAVS